MNDQGLGSFWALIFPRWGRITSGTVEAVTPILVIVICIIAAWACTYALWKAWSARRRVEQARVPIAGVVPTDLRARRGDVAAAAARCGDKVVRDAWREFDETLVSDDEGLYNTVEAAEFFNEHRFAPQLVNNRFLHAAPTALTTIGLLGTFIGLTVGLRNLDLGSTAEELRDGIQTLVTGAALGFTASLWGVFWSLVTNVVERLAERSVVKRVSKLQADIDELFTLRSPEQSLSEIANHTSASSEALQVLHEKIGSALQESVRDIADQTNRAVTDAISNSLAPIMTDLAERAANQSAEVFEVISGKLTASFDAIGRELADQLKASSESMRNTLDYMGQQLARHADEHITQMRELQQAANEQLGSVVAATDRQITMLDESLPRIVVGLESAADLVGAATTGMKDVTNGLAQVTTGLSETSSTLGGMLASAIETMDAMATRTAAAAGALAEQQASVSELTGKTVEAAELLRQASTTLNGGFEGMRTAQASFLGQLEKDLHKHSESMSGWLTSYGDQVSKQTYDRMNEWNKHTSEFTSQMLSATRALSDAIDEASTPRPDDAARTSA